MKQTYNIFMEIFSSVLKDIWRFLLLLKTPGLGESCWTARASQDSFCNWLVSILTRVIWVVIWLERWWRVGPTAGFPLQRTDTKTTAPGWAPCTKMPCHQIGQWKPGEKFIFPQFARTQTICNLQSTQIKQDLKFLLEFSIAKIVGKAGYKNGGDICELTTFAVHHEYAYFLVHNFWNYVILPEITLFQSKWSKRWDLCEFPERRSFGREFFAH